MPAYTLHFPTGYSKALLPSLSERTALAFARSESAVLRNTVSLKLGDVTVATFANGERI